MDRCTLLYLKWITYRAAQGLCSVLCGSLDGSEFGGEWIHGYVLSCSTLHLKPEQPC